MKIEEKVKKLGMNEDIINELHSKTKLARFEIKSIKFNSKLNDILCFDVEIDNPRRRFYTIHTTHKKMLKLNRDILIDKILD